MEKYLDATDSIVGRVAVVAAKAGLMGHKVVIVNCEKAVISGKRQSVLANADVQRARPGRPTKGPFIPRTTDKYVRRMISRMLPRENVRGREALARIMTYTGMPDEFKDKKFEKVPGSEYTKLPNYKFITIAEVCKHLGAKR
jgi:large subunit ribosomal protein L13